MIINNGIDKKEEEELTPVFSYQVHNPAVPNNSYWRFMEMQQQQQ